MKEYIEIPYVLNGRKRTIFFNDVRGYKKVIHSSIYGASVAYNRGDKFYFFNISKGDEFISFSCCVGREHIPVDYSDAEKFIDIKCY